MRRRKNLGELSFFYFKKRLPGAVLYLNEEELLKCRQYFYAANKKALAVLRKAIKRHSSINKSNES